jgi:hypothetical protein
MNKKRIYISLPISGHPIYSVMSRALSIKEKLMDGYWAITPFDICSDLTQPYSYFMGEDIKELLECDAVYFAKGWEKSRGCRLEHSAAEIYGKEILYEK